jgi:hypothetical protein
MSPGHFLGLDQPAPKEGSSSAAGARPDFANTTAEATPIALSLPTPAEPAATPARTRVAWIPDADRAARSMQDLLQLDGVLICALIDGGTSVVIASAGNAGEVDRAAQAASEIMRTHRRTLRLMGHWRPSDPVDEVLVTAGSRYHVMRALNGHPDHFVLCVLDKLRCNLATTRFRIMEAQQALS